MEERRANSRRILARVGACAPDLKLRMAWREDVESDTIQELGWIERASLRVCSREKSSAVCWLSEAYLGRMVET